MTDYVNYIYAHPSYNYENSSGGILSHLSKPQEPVGRWDGVWAYIDRDFYEELQDVRFPLDQFSFYEKLLFGVLRRRSIYSYYSERSLIRGVES